MKVNHHQFNLDTPAKDLYQQGVDFLQHDFELNFDETFHLLKNLQNHRSSLFVESATCALSFYIEKDNSLWVEVMDSANLWAISKIDLEIAKEILKIAVADGIFEEHMPTTNRFWDGYSI